VERIEMARATLADLRAFERAAANDPFADRDDLLDGIDRDVLIVFVESYGRASLDTPLYAATHRATLNAAEEAPRRARAVDALGLLRAPTRGGQSWLSHATFANGLWIANQTSYGAALASDRRTLFHIASDAGFRTAAVMPQITLDWPESARMGFETVLAAGDLGYAGLPFNWVTMPDQFTFAALDRLLRTASDDRPLFVQVALGSSHAPWVPVPQLVPWDEIGDGTCSTPWRSRAIRPSVVWRDRDRVRDQYRQAVDYALSVVFDYAARHAADPPLIFVVGDHQAAGFVALDDRPDVPIHVIGPDALVVRHRCLGLERGPDPSETSKSCRWSDARPHPRCLLTPAGHRGPTVDRPWPAYPKLAGEAGTGCDRPGPAGVDLARGGRAGGGAQSGRGRLALARARVRGSERADGAVRAALATDGAAVRHHPGHRRPMREYYLVAGREPVAAGRHDRGRGPRRRSRGQAGLLAAGQAVVFERLAGQIALFATLGVAFVVTLAIPGGLDWPRWLIAPVPVSCDRHQRAGPCAGGGTPAWRCRSDCVQVPERLRHRARSALRLAGQIALSLGTTICNLAAFAFCARAVGVDLSLAAVAALVPLILFTMLIPISVSGWGLREGAAAALSAGGRGHGQRRACRKRGLRAGLRGRFCPGFLRTGSPRADARETAELHPATDRHGTIRRGAFACFHRKRNP
jgi:hypothetical protein